MQPEHPADSGVAVGVAAILLVLVVQINKRAVCLGGVGRPFENLFAPVHPHVVVHPAREHHLALGGVPVGVVGGGGLQLGAGVQILVMVVLVLTQGLLRPVRQHGKAVVVRVVPAEVETQLAPHDQFLQVGGRAGAAVRLHRQRHLKRRNVPIMQVRREPRGAVEGGNVAVCVVAVQAFQEGGELRLGRHLAALFHARWHALDTETRNQRRRVRELAWVQPVQGGRLRGVFQTVRGSFPCFSHQILLQRPVDAGPDGAGRVLLLDRGDFQRHDQLRLDLRQRQVRVQALQFGAQPLAPPTQMPQVGPFGHDQGGVRGQCQRRLGGAVFAVQADQQGQLPRPQAHVNVAQPFEQKLVVAGVGAGVAGRQTEHHQHRQAQAVGLGNGVIERLVVP